MLRARLVSLTTVGVLTACGGEQTAVGSGSSSSSAGSAGSVTDATGPTTTDTTDAGASASITDVTTGDPSGNASSGGSGGTADGSEASSGATTSTGDATTGTGDEATAGSSSTTTGAGVYWTRSFGDGPADVQGVTTDTHVTIERPGDGNGVHTDFHFYEGAGATALLRFELTVISPGSDVVDAVLRLTTESEGIRLERIQIFELLEDWEEGAEDFAPGHANWLDRMDGVAWTTPGAGPGSRDTVELASFVASGTNWTYEIPIPPDVIQGWVDDPTSNFGFALTAEIRPEGTVGPGPGDVLGLVPDELSWTASSENANPDARPMLLVTTALSAP